MTVKQILVHIYMSTFALLVSQRVMQHLLNVQMNMQSLVFLLYTNDLPALEAVVL